MDFELFSIQYMQFYPNLDTKFGCSVSTGICTLVLGRRMGFLEQEVDPKVGKLATAVKCQFCASRDTFYGLPFWKVFPTPAYKSFVKSEEEIYE